MGVLEDGTRGGNAGRKSGVVASDTQLNDGVRSASRKTIGLFPCTGNPANSVYAAYAPVGQESPLRHVGCAEVVPRRVVTPNGKLYEVL